MAVILSASGAGCGTVDNVRRPVLRPAPNTPDDKLCRVYGGLRGHWDAITDYPWRNPPTWLDYVVIPAMAIVDLGLTAVGDTFTLPYTVGAEVWRALHPEGKAPSAPLVVEVPVVPVPVPTGAEVPPTEK